MEAVNPADRLVSRAEAAAVLGISLRSLASLIQRGELAVTRPSPGRTLIARSEIERYVRSKTEARKVT